MNRSKIEWCDHTWNPITGCRHNCNYCYAKKMTSRFSGDIRLNKMATGDYELKEAADGNGKLYILNNPMLNETEKPLVYPFGFEPTFHKYRLGTLEKLKMGNNIFVGAMADMFGEWVPDEWIGTVLNECLKHPQHNYLFLTKNPKRYWDLEKKGILPTMDNMWYGFSYSSNSCEGWASKYNDKHNFVSVEPLLEDLLLFDESCIRAGQWVIIGAETGNRREKVIPKKEWIDKILRHCDIHKIPVFMKDSLLSVVGEQDMRRDFPDQLKHKQISDRMKDKLYDLCNTCKTQYKKSDMIALSARSCRGEQPKQFGFMCKKCFKDFCIENDIEIPNLKNLEG